MRLSLLTILFPAIFCISVAGFANPPVHNSPPMIRFRVNPVPRFLNDPVITMDSSSCIIPFNRAGNLILIQAKADTMEGNFILDTGAPGLILNTTYFRNYPSSAEPDAEHGGITGEVRSASATLVNLFSMGPVKYYKADADRADLGHIENKEGVKILGLLGMQLFERFEMIIDYEKSVIYLHLVTRKEVHSYASEQLKDTAGYRLFNIDIFDHKLLTYGLMGKKKLCFIIDTGAESNVMDSRLPDKLFENFTINRRVTLTGTGKAKVEALYGDMHDIKVGDLDLTTLPVLITNLEKMCLSYDRCLDGILGFDFLSLHKIGFNFVTHKMYIWK